MPIRGGIRFTRELDFGVNYLEGTILKNTIQSLWDNEHEKANAIAKQWMEDGVEHIYYVGCGGSRAIMEPVKLLLDRFCPFPSDAYTGWEFVNRAPRRLNRKSAVILASHSGTTEEVLKGLELA